MSFWGQVPELRARQADQHAIAMRVLGLARAGGDMEVANAGIAVFEQPKEVGHKALVSPDKIIAIGGNFNLHKPQGRRTDRPDGPSGRLQKNDLAAPDLTGCGPIGRRGCEVRI